MDEPTKVTDRVGTPPAGLEVSNLPAVVVRPQPPLRRPRRWAWLLVLLAVGIGGGAYYWLRPGQVVPAGIAFGNGRLEADEIDIDTKFAGRIAELRADEGDLVAAGQVLAVMDTRDLQASLAKAQAVVLQSGHAVDEAKANPIQAQAQIVKSEALVEGAQKALEEAQADLAQQQTQVTLAQQELDRARTLAPEGSATLELLDQRRQQMDAAVDGRLAAVAHVNAAERALDAGLSGEHAYAFFGGSGEQDGAESGGSGRGGGAVQV